MDQNKQKSGFFQKVRSSISDSIADSVGKSIGLGVFAIFTGVVAIFGIAQRKDEKAEAPSATLPTPSPTPMTTPLPKPLPRLPETPPNAEETRYPPNQLANPPVAEQAASTSQPDEPTEIPVRQVAFTAQQPPISLDISPNPLGLTGSISKPVIISNKWTMMTFRLTLRAKAKGGLGLPADYYGKMPGWSATLGGNETQCISGSGQIEWPAGRGEAISLNAGEAIDIPVQFTCGYGNDYAPGGAASIAMQFFIDDGGNPETIRIRIAGAPFIPPPNKR